MVQQIVTKGYKPEKVLGFFEELCKIPHGSGNEEAVAKYIENFSHVGNNTTKITKSFLEENGFV